MWLEYRQKKRKTVNSKWYITIYMSEAKNEIKTNNRPKINHLLQ